jgi:cAMP-dependent protein kinase regulator
MGNLCNQCQHEPRPEVKLDRSQTEQETEDDEDDSDDDVEDLVEVKFERLGKGRQSVCAEASAKWEQKDLDSLTKIEKTAEQKERILTAMKKSFAFNALNEDETHRVVLALKEVKFTKGDTVIKEGALVDATDNGLYIVDSGHLKVFKGEAHVHTYTSPGDTFGEQALLYNCPRAATVVADGNCTLWALQRNAFSGLVLGAMMARREETNGLIASLDFLRPVSAGDKAKLADVIRYETFAPGSEIVRQGDDGDAFYIVKSGKLEAVVAELGSEPVMTYGAGSYFGELALLSGSSGKRKATVRVVEKATVMSVERASFKRLLGSAEALLKERASQYEKPTQK